MSFFHSRFGRQKNHNVQSLDLRDDDTAIGPHFEVNNLWGSPSAMSSSPISSSSSRYYEVNKKESPERANTTNLLGPFRRIRQNPAYHLC